jgi:hypothetical protein
MMQTTHITVDRAEAAALYRKYREHASYSQPIDWEIQRTYQLLAKGKLVIKALDSVVAAGVNEAGLPKLAIASATAKACFLERTVSGACTMSSSDQWRSNKNRYQWQDGVFTFPPDSFPISWNRKDRSTRSSHQAVLPLIPIHLRPKRGLANYHVLWEAEWQPLPPRDPYLLRRIGKADLWLVVAHWDLTEVERAALATRIAVRS